MATRYYNNRIHYSTRCRRKGKSIAALLSVLCTCEDATVLNLVLGAFIAVFMGAMLQVG